MNINLETVTVGINFTPLQTESMMSRINLNQKATRLAVNCVFILVSRSQTRLGET